MSYKTAGAFSGGIASIPGYHKKEWPGTGKQHEPTLPTTHSLPLHPDIKLKMKVNPDPTDFKIIDCKHDELLDKNIVFGEVTAHQSGYKATHTLKPHTETVFGETKFVKQINFTEDKPLDYNFETQVVNDAMLQFKQGYKAVPSKKVKGTLAVLQADPDSVIKKERRMGAMADFGYGGGGYWSLDENKK